MSRTNRTKKNGKGWGKPFVDSLAEMMGEAPRRWASVEEALAELEFHEPTWVRGKVETFDRRLFRNDPWVCVEWATPARGPKWLRKGPCKAERILLRDEGGWFFTDWREAGLGS